MACFGCRQCAPGQHLPPPVHVVPDYKCPKEPDECSRPTTPKMKEARNCRIVEWLLTVGLILTMGVMLYRGELKPAPGPHLWFWGSLVVLAIWGAASASLALSKVSTTDSITLMMGCHWYLSTALIAWIVGVATGGTVRLVAALVALVFSVIEMYRLYCKGIERPSLSTYLVYIGFKAFLAGLTLFVFTLLVDHHFGRVGAIVVLGLVGGWISFDNYSFVVTLAPLAGLVAWELQEGTEFELVGMIILFSLLFINGVAYRLISPRNHHGRNMFVEFE